MLEKKQLYKIYSNCRRGMLELDIILINFIEKEYLNLDKKELDEFIHLLNESDHNLYDWIIKNNNNYDKNLEIIIKKIKENKKRMFNLK